MTGQHLARVPAIAVAGMLLVACGGGGLTAPSTSVPVAVAPLRIIWDSSFFAPAGDPRFAAVLRERVSNVPSGPVVVTLEWTPTVSDVRIQVTNFDCPGGLINGELHNDECSIYAQANAKANGLQTIEFTNTGTRGLALWISNYSSTVVNYRLKVAVPGAASAPTPPTPPATPTPVGPIGEVALLATSIPFGQSVPTVRLGSAGQAAPTLTFTIAVRTFQSQTGLLARVWVRRNGVRCMGTGISNLSFAGGEQRVLNTFNVSFQSGNDPAPCGLPYTTSEVEITLDSGATQLLSQVFAGGYTFLLPS